MRFIGVQTYRDQICSRVGNLNTNKIIQFVETYNTDLGLRPSDPEMATLWDQAAAQWIRDVNEQCGTAPQLQINRPFNIQVSRLPITPGRKPQFVEKPQSEPQKISQTNKFLIYGGLAFIGYLALKKFKII
jgi:hypothetical protein